MYYCGWDGGGTKTELCAVDTQGKPLASAVFGPMNVNGASHQAVEATIRDGVQWMASLPGGLAACGAMVIGTAGVSNHAALALVEGTVRRQGYDGLLRIVGDQEIALAGAVQGPGAVLIAGTGAICFGRDPGGRSFRTGGCGYLIDDGGSGYAIGRDILSAVVRAMDGRGKDTCLKDQVLSFLQVQDASGIITWLYAPEQGKKDVAALSPLLLQALGTGDQAAGEIALRAAEELSLLAIAAWEKTGMTDGELALTGSILNRYPTIRDAVVSQVHQAFPGISIRAPWGTAAQGAAQLALEAGRETSEE